MKLQSVHVFMVEIHEPFPASTDERQLPAYNG